MPPTAGSRSPPPAHINQRMSLDLALASSSMQRMALRFEDVKICRRPDGSLWKLGSGGFGTVSASCCPECCLYKLRYDHSITLRWLLQSICYHAL